ncbi:MAG: hypothetical protein LBI94_01015 [Treponema sp.]|jgi:hypothetical protein|nr:hypothetical protein [Treponema sp.]
MDNGAISYNKAQDSSGGGGGVYIANGNGMFTMEDGVISGNRTPGRGGGVYMATEEQFKMNDGAIYGVYVNDPEEKNIADDEFTSTYYEANQGAQSEDTVIQFP